MVFENFHFATENGPHEIFITEAQEGLNPY